MISMEKTQDWLKGYGDNVTAVETSERGFVRALLANPIDHEHPYRLIVHPIAEKLLLKVRVSLTQISRTGELLGLIGKLNYEMLCGSVGVDSDGEVIFEINHACRDGEAEDPPKEVFHRILDDTADKVESVSRILLHACMVEAGVPEAVARRIMDTQFAREPEEEETL